MNLMGMEGLAPSVEHGAVCAFACAEMPIVFRRRPRPEPGDG